MSVTVYTSPACQPCRATKRRLDALGVPYEVVDVSTDDAARTWLLEEGLRQSPVVRAETPAGVVVWDGHRPERIAALAEALS